MTCNLGNLASGAAATVTIVVTPRRAGTISNTATVAADVSDSDPENNTMMQETVVSLLPHDLAIVNMTAPKSITLSERIIGNLTKTRRMALEVQNRSPHEETIPDMAALSNLVTLTVESLGGCPNPILVMLAPKKRFPIILQPKKTLDVVFELTFSCANDRAGSTRKDPGHEDYRYVVTVNHAALDGNPDTHPGDDVCPREPLPGGIDPNPDGSVKDRGCGARKPDGTLGADVLSDIIVK